MAETTLNNGASGIFRPSAIARLSSPEELDQQLKVVSPWDWVGVAVLAVLFACGAAWLVAGTVHQQVVGTGIIVPEGGRILEASAPGAGVLVAILARAGDRVARGEPVAQVRDEALDAEVLAARDVRDDEERRHAALERALDEERATRTASFEDSVTALAAAIAAAAGEGGDGATSPAPDEGGPFPATAATRRHVTDLRAQRASLVERHVAASNAHRAELRRSLDRVSAARRAFAALETEQARRSVVLAPADGTVTEWAAAPATSVGPGDPIVRIETGSGGRELLLYLAAGDGKRVVPGMTAFVDPATGAREENGSIVGTVSAVSAFPVSREAMVATLRNTWLVDRFARSGAPIEARVTLARDEATPSGYRWTGGRGPDAPVTTGTLAEARVTLERRAPISFVLPSLRDRAASER